MALTPINATKTPEKTIRLLFLGDVFGEPGRKAVIDLIPKLKERHQIDFVVVNGENSAGGRGITPRICIALLRAGAAVVTLGDHAWDQPEIINYMETEPRLLRPLNYPEGTPGQGSIVLETDKGKVAVLCAQGRTFTNPPLENPFLAAEKEVARLREETPVIFMDFHAEATSEKIGMGRAMDGKVSGVIGTHTHVQTADEGILPGGTAYLTDCGMTGGHGGVIGMRKEGVLPRFLTAMPTKFDVCEEGPRMNAVMIEIDEETGKAFDIRRVDVPLE